MPYKHHKRHFPAQRSGAENKLIAKHSVSKKTGCVPLWPGVAVTVQISIHSPTPSQPYTEDKYQVSLALVKS